MVVPQVDDHPPSMSVLPVTRPVPRVQIAGTLTLSGKLVSTGDAATGTVVTAAQAPKNPMVKATGAISIAGRRLLTA